MNQMDMWGPDIQPKQAKQTPQPAKEKPAIKSGSGTERVTAESSAEHMAARIEHTFAVAVSAFHNAGDNMRNLTFQENKRLELAERVKVIEQKFASFIEAHNQDMQILKESLTALFAEEVLPEEQLSSPETENSIHDN